MEARVTKVAADGTMRQITRWILGNGPDFRGRLVPTPITSRLSGPPSERVSKVSLRDCARAGKTWPAAAVVPAAAVRLRKLRRLIAVPTPL